MDCRFLATLIISLICWLPVAGHAAPGDLDTTFGGGAGWVTAQLSPALPQGTAHSLIQAADGKLVAAGNLEGKIALVRYSNEGSLDTMFGVDGVASEQVSNNGGGIETLIQQNDGKLVVGGGVSRYNGSNNTDFMLARFDQNGIIDTSFDTDGFVVSPMSGSNEFYVDAHDIINSLVQQADGKIVAFGSSYTNSAAIVRYNTDGSVDSSFSSASLSPPSFSQADSVFLNDDGKFIVAGSAYYSPSEDDDFTFKKLNSNGTVDTSFGISGVVYIDVRGVGVSKDAMGASIQRKDGSIIAAGISNLGGGSGDNYLGIVKLLPSGSLDTSFATGGRYLSYSIFQNWDSVSAMVGLSDNSIVVAGRLQNGTNTMVRFTDAGVVDTSFGAAGYAVLSIDGMPFYPRSVIERRDGKLAVAGYVMDTGVTRFVVAVYQTGQTDSDGDGYTDLLDNCSSVSNPEQLDNDKDGLGDGCDTDDDNDGIADIFDALPLNAAESVDTDSDGIGNNADTDDDNDAVDDVVDNCMLDANATQADTDSDSQGDACDADDDNDGLMDASDNCTLIINASQANTDGDSEGDACDADDDNDTVEDLLDNCSLVGNATQANSDEDAQGDACDADDDNDGVMDIADAFPLNALESVDTDSDGIGNNADSDDDNDGLVDTFDAFPLNASESIDTDGDGVGNNTDIDDDSDGVIDASDNCPLLSNSSQTNADSDTQGDACDVDDDGDDIVDTSDNCPLASNSTQTNIDGDSQGDVCDIDDDGDAVVDASDNCPLIANTNQLDWDGDGLGDRCDDPVPLPADISGVLGKDSAGKSVAFAGDFNKDGYGDYVIGIPGFDASEKDAGSAQVVSGKNGTVLASISGTAAKEALGTAVAGNADIDNDGFDDVIVGSPNAGATHTGSVTILYGPNGSRNQTIPGSAVKSLFGSSLALGDVNGDSRADILVGAPKDDDVANKRTDSGSVTVLSGSGFGQLQKFHGSSAKANAGTSVASGDINNDGSADIIIGAPNDNGTGSVIVYDLAGDTLLQKSGETAKAQFGQSVASGDVNNDGKDDVLVGAPADDNGATKDVGSVTVFSGNGGTPLTKKYGTVAKANFGSSVAAGDVNGDGFADIIAGASKDDKPAAKVIKDAGSISVFSGNGYAPITTRYGNAAKDYFGFSVSAGDINSDGKDDIIIGIPGFDVPATKPIKDAGKVTVLSGTGF